MARDPSKLRKGPKARAEVTPKQRMSYVMIRIAELSAEMEKLKVERKILREKITATRVSRTSGEDD